MKIRKLWKDASSITGDCPALYAVVDGEPGYVVQGKIVGPEVLGQLSEFDTASESAVWVPANVLDRLAEGR